MDYLDSSTAPILRQHERIGMQKYATPEGDLKFRYGKEHAKAMLGVAWFVEDDLLRRFPDYFPRPVDLVKPKVNDDEFPVIKTIMKGDKAQEIRMSVVDCLVKIRWLIDGKAQSSWESRDTARRVFKGKKKADVGIYMAAMDQEELFEKWMKKPEAGRDRSATPWPLGLTPTPERDLQTPDRDNSPTGGLIPGRGPSEDREDTPNSTGRSPASKAGGSIPKQSLADWRGDV
jgi:hypothetical protein